MLFNLYIKYYLNEHHLDSIYTVFSIKFMARNSQKVQVTLPDNIYAVIEAMTESGETASEYCARAIINKVEHDLMVKLPDKWQAFTAKSEPKEP